MPRGMNPPEHNEPDDILIGPKNRDRGIRKNRVELWTKAPETPKPPTVEVVCKKIAYNRPEIPSVSAAKAREVSAVIKRRTRSENAAQRLSRDVERAQRQMDARRVSLKKK